MTHGVITELEQMEVLSTTQAIGLRTYIKDKYQNYTNQQIALVFADAVHKVLDRELAVFPEEKRISIKRQALIETIHRSSFSISGLDVFKGIVKTQKDSLEGLDFSKEWLKTHFEKNEYLDVEKTLDEYLSLHIKASKPIVALDKGMDSTDINSYLLQESISITPNIHMDLALSKEKIDGLYGTSRVSGIEDMESKLNSLWDIGRDKVEKIRNTFTDPVWRGSIVKKVRTPLKVSLVTVGISALIVTGESIDSPLSKYPVYSPVASNSISLNKITIVPTETLNNGHDLLKYKEVSKDSLRQWLESRGSILAQEPYLSAILGTAEAYNINPLLLVAITGQEQGFVPLKNPMAKTIANNPFNVFGSWEKHNTDIYDATAIAARTVIKLSKDCPKDVHPIEWINRKYAEDQNWWKGVTAILNQLENKVYSYETVTR